MASPAVHIELPYLPPAEFSRNARCHWAVLHRAQERVNDDVYALLVEAGWTPGQTWEKASIKITLLLPDERDRDWDNLVTRCKPVLDALVNAGRIKDGGKMVAPGFLAGDSLRAIGIPEIVPQYRKGRPGTLITVRETR